MREYELLFTVPADSEREFNKEAKASGMRFYRLGTITKNCRTAVDGGDRIDLSSLKIEARSFDNARPYLKALTDWILQQKARNSSEDIDRGA